MKTILISALILILLAAGVMFYRDSYVKRKFKKLAAQRYGIVSPLIQKLDAKEIVSSLEVLTMAKDPGLRLGVYRVLEVYNRIDLFPAEFLTRAKGAEGFLVNWLEYPTELGSPPGEIEFLTTVTILDVEPMDYYVFKYKTKLPHKSAQHDWMLGVSGPYHEDSLPYDVPLRVFSRFNAVDSISPEHEVQWVHANIGHA